MQSTTSNMAQQKICHLPQTQSQSTNAPFTPESRPAPPSKIKRQNAIAGIEEPSGNTKPPVVMHQLSLPIERLGRNKDDKYLPIPTVATLQNDVKENKKPQKKQVIVTEPTLDVTTDITIVVPLHKSGHGSKVKVQKTCSERCKTAHVKPISRKNVANAVVSSSRGKVTKQKRVNKSNACGSEKKGRLRRSVSAVESSTQSRSKKHKFVRQESVPVSVSNKKLGNKSFQAQQSVSNSSFGKNTVSHVSCNEPKKQSTALQLSLASQSKVQHPNKKETCLNTEATGIHEVADRHKRRSLSAVNNTTQENNLKPTAKPNLTMCSGNDVTKISKRISSAVSIPSAQLSRQNSVQINQPRSNNPRFLKQVSLPSETIGNYLPDGTKRTSTRTALSPVTNAPFRPNKERKTVNFSDAIAFPEVATVISEVSPVPSDVENTDGGTSWIVQISGRTQARGSYHTPAFLSRTYNHPQSLPNTGKGNEKTPVVYSNEVQAPHIMPRISSATKKSESKAYKNTSEAGTHLPGASTPKTIQSSHCDAMNLESVPQKIPETAGKPSGTLNQQPNKLKERKILGTKPVAKNEATEQRKLVRANTAPEVPVQEENIPPPASPIIHHLGTETECLVLHKKLITNGLTVPLVKIKRALMTPTEYRLLQARSISVPK